MKFWGKLVVFLFVALPIVFCYYQVRSLWTEDDLANKTDINEVNNNYAASKNAEDNINEVITETIAGETYTSKIGTPIGKIVEGGEVNISVANVYLDSDELSDVVGTLKKSSIVISQAYPEGWSRIKSDTVSGWMRSEYIDIPEEKGDTSVGGVVGRTAVVNVTSLNIRAAATTSGKLKDMLTEGTAVTITEVSEDGEWYKIKWQSLDGWAAKKYLTLK